MTAVIVIFCILSMFLCIEIIRELRNFQITRYHISTPKLPPDFPGRRIVFLSDLHNQTYGSDNERLTAAIRSEKPDLILVGGDMLVSKTGQSFDTALRFLCGLKEICPVYCANGNHEQRLKSDLEDYGLDYSAYKNTLAKAGVRILENESVLLNWGNSPVRIIGLEIPMSCYRRMGRIRLQTEAISLRVGNSHPEEYQILLAHNPEHMEVYREWGADLILSGHLHGGIVRIPKGAGVISPSLKLFPRYSGGIYRESGVTAVVSRGLGTHTIPVRLFNMPEVVVLDISGTHSPIF